MKIVWVQLQTLTLKSLKHRYNGDEPLSFLIRFSSDIWQNAKALDSI